MASQQTKSEAGSSTELDAAEVERRRKQRDLKRKSRERKKNNLLELQTTAQALELEYKQLFAAKLMREQQQLDVSAAMKGEPNAADIEQPRLVELQEKYKAVRQEMHELREQMTDFKQKLEEYERFIAMLDGHLMGSEKKARNEPIAASRAASTAPVEVARTVRSAGPPTTTTTTTTSATSPSTPTPLNTTDKVRSAPMGKARAYEIALRAAARKEAATKAGRQPPAKKAAPPNRVFAGEYPRYPAAAAGHKPTDTPVATRKTAGKQCQKVTRKDIAEQKKASQELAAAQRAADARTVREATKAAQASGEKARKDAQEHTDEEFAALWDDQGEDEDPADMTDDIETDESPVGTSSPGPGTPHEARTADQHCHELVECPEFQTIGGVQRCARSSVLDSKKRAYLCIVCARTLGHGRNRPRPRFGHAIQMRATAAKQRHKRRRPTAGQDDEGTVAATAGDKNGADRGEDGDESHGVVTAAV
ncbi:hypothetical protein JG687_00007722 [Phytophthora cactorum]|uniref:BZIP domain-containing protein n=1 Tax=Phytophthora cactorum TaxID=29920 RepID=A0A8T1UEB3_9STRA|nr:hypothetical protein JG687_00007722 [Phytophthora cactorum]